MLAYIWPMALVVFSNVVYQICAKSVPQDMNPFASLTITYLVSAAACFVLFFVMGNDASLIGQSQLGAFCIRTCAGRSGGRLYIRL